MQRASEELRKLVSDLQDRVNALEAERTDTSTPTLEPPDVTAAPAPSNSVLWVDDSVEANVYERARLTEAGRRIVQARSTAAALQSISEDGPFGVIVSDMSREENGRFNFRAGLDLLRELRAAGDETRVVFYSSPRGLSAVRAELDRADHVAYTTSPTELMALLQVDSEN